MKVCTYAFALCLTIVFGLVSAMRTDLVCAESPMIYSKGRLADARNCAHAMIRGFPFHSDLGTFHRYGKDDLFSLPKSSTYDDCTVTIDIQSDVLFQSSWTAVFGLASTMNVACGRYLNTAGMLYTGGSLVAGVVITMGKTPRVGGAVNGTELVAELANATGRATE